MKMSHVARLGLCISLYLSVSLCSELFCQESFKSSEIELSPFDFQINEEEFDPKKKGKNGRRKYRQLGYSFLFKEYSHENPESFRYGTSFSSGHIKDRASVGYLWELLSDSYTQSKDTEEGLYEEVIANVSLLFGTIFKLYKTDRFLVYGKTSAGVMGSVSIQTFDSKADIYDLELVASDYAFSYNYKASAGINFKLIKSFGLFCEAGYSRTVYCQAGIAFLYD
jgi:hypothetical protein